MFTEFHPITFLGRMTTSNFSDRFFFVLEEDKKQIEIEVPSNPSSEFPDGPQLEAHEIVRGGERCEATASSQEELKRPSLGETETEVAENDDGSRTRTSAEELKRPRLGESEASEDDDGFRTPTSSDHKIPVVCPPAPKKLIPHKLSTKRKSPPPRIRRRLQLDLSKEVESMFPPLVQENFGRKIKRGCRMNL